MLVLTRRAEESVIIDLNTFVKSDKPEENLVRVKVIKCHGANRGHHDSTGSARLGFECRKDIPIDREEIYEARKAETEQSK